MRTKRAIRVHVVTMGCAKNLVDSENLLAQLQAGGLELCDSAEGADVAIINTCGFIQAAKEETLEEILGLIRLKSSGRLKRIFAMGCLTERYRKELPEEIPEVDRFFGTHQMEEVLRELGADFRTNLLGERILLTPPHTAYLKISEGCDRPCSFCAIPLMRGSHRSRPLEEVLEEARRLARRGVRELVVIGQDTTSYGLDTEGRQCLRDLLEKLGSLEGIRWVRLMYAYPAKFPLEILETIASHPHLCNYVDIPLQHVADRVLRSMRRGISGRGVRELVATIRERFPGLALRTTMIAGYPTEGAREFEELVDFVREARFDRLGVFTYSPEEGTTAFSLGDPIPLAEKERRRAVLMEAQQECSRERNESLIGKRLEVLIERREQKHFVGRTEFDAPEIDNEVLVRTEQSLDLGSFYPVDIVGAYEYDILGMV